MKGRKPILCLWLPDVTPDNVGRITKKLEKKIGEDYHVIVISNDRRAVSPKIEILGTGKLSKRKCQTIINAINK